MERERIERALEKERRTMHRQVLLKQLWKLDQEDHADHEEVEFALKVAPARPPMSPASDPATPALC